MGILQPRSLRPDDVPLSLSSSDQGSNISSPVRAAVVPAVLIVRIEGWLDAHS
jgi:hypothetical protein